MILFDSGWPEAQADQSAGLSVRSKLPLLRIVNLITLILGGVKSGKSREAERLATNSKLDVTVLATARADDAEMRNRIAMHQSSRPANWGLIEEPVAIGKALQQSCQSTAPQCVILDCLTLWMTQIIELPDDLFNAERESLLNAMDCINGELVIVSNESGLGVTPIGNLSRRYLDEIGLLHQTMASKADRVLFMIAGLAQELKSPD